MASFQKLDQLFHELSTTHNWISFHNLIYGGYEHENRGQNTIKKIKEILTNLSKTLDGVVFYEYESFKNCIAKEGDLILHYYTDDFETNFKQNRDLLYSKLIEHDFDIEYDEDFYTNHPSFFDHKPIKIKRIKLESIPNEMEYGLLKTLQYVGLNFNDFRLTSQKNIEEYDQLFYCYKTSYSPFKDINKNISLNYVFYSFINKGVIFGNITWPRKLEQNMAGMDYGSVLFEIEQEELLDIDIFWVNEHTVELYFPSKTVFKSKKEVIDDPTSFHPQENQKITVFYKEKN